MSTITQRQANNMLVRPTSHERLDYEHANNASGDGGQYAATDNDVRVICDAELVADRNHKLSKLVYRLHFTHLWVYKT